MKNIGTIISISMIVSLLFISAFVNATTEEINNIAEVPIGSIIMYNGNEYDFNLFGYLINDTRFHMCDGNNGTVNLLHSYVACFDAEETDYDTIGETFGDDSYNLTISQLPYHKHTYIDWYPLFTLTPTGLGQSFALCRSVGIRTSDTGYTGSNAQIDNRPYTTVVNFIQRIN